MNADGSIVQGDIRVQTKFALEGTAQTLQEVGSSMGDVVKATINLPLSSLRSPPPGVRRGAKLT